jgi:predicted transcriptional regulator
MEGREQTIPIEALEDIGYISRSVNRVVILDALTEGAYSRRELTEVTGVSRTTLDRIVNELDERGWATRTTDGEYVSTTAGTHFMREFRPFIDAVEALRQLGEAVEWLPDDELELGLQHFRDANVRRPEKDDPVETVEYMERLVRDASEFRTLTHLVPPTSLLQAMRDGVVTGRLTLEAVSSQKDSKFPSEQPHRRNLWEEILQAGAALYFCEGPIPCNLWVIGETVLIKKSGPKPIDESYGVPIVSTNSSVRSWAHDLIDQYRSEATRIDDSIVA